MTWMVTGGAGYIGAHVVRAFQEVGLDAVVVDDLSSGHREFVPEDVPFVEGTIVDTGLLAATMREHERRRAWSTWPASSTPASRSTGRCTPTTRTSPARSACCGRCRTPASTRWCSPRARPPSAPPTSTPSPRRPRPRPESPYGESQAGRRVAAARPGRRHRPAAHVAALLQRGRLGQRPTSTTPARTTCSRWSSRRCVAGRTPRINGDDYPTPDGTCVRDYVHVADLARLPRRRRPGAAAGDAAGAGLQPRQRRPGSRCGRSWTRWPGSPASTSRPRSTRRRPGDPARIVASGELAARDLDWRMRHTVDDMVASAWQARRRSRPARPMIDG